MAAAEGLVQGPASIGAELVVVMVTWSICSPCISLRRARRRSKDDWVPLCRASRLVLSSRHFCQGRGGQRQGSQNSTVQASWGSHPAALSPKAPPLPLQRPKRNQAEGLTKKQAAAQNGIQQQPDAPKFVFGHRARNVLMQECGSLFPHGDAT